MGSWQRDAKSCAASRRAFYADVSRMLLNNAVGHCQTEAGAAADSLGRVKRIVNLGDIFRSDSQTRIGNFDNQRMFLGRNCCDPN